MIEFLSVVLCKRLEADYIKWLQRVGGMWRKDHQENLVVNAVGNKLSRYMAAMAINNE